MVDDQFLEIRSDERYIFKGAASIGKNWLFSTYGAWPLGELAFTPQGVELSLPWKKEMLKWEQISSVSVRYGRSIYFSHQTTSKNCYLVFVPKSSDWKQISEMMKAMGFSVIFRGWF